MRPLALGFVLLTLNALAQPALITPDAHKHLMLDSRVMLRSTNAKLNFTLGNLDVEAKEFTQLLRIANPSATGLTNTAIPATPISNTTTITTFTASSGLFVGSFTINGATTTLNRPASFYGQIVKIGGITQGYGYFLLPTATAKVSTSPKLSGRVVLGLP